MSDRTRRYLPIPHGLAGERLDVGLTRLLGISRSLAASLTESDAVLVDGVPARKSDRLMADSWIEFMVENRSWTTAGAGP